MNLVSKFDGLSSHNPISLSCLLCYGLLILWQTMKMIATGDQKPSCNPLTTSHSLIIGISCVILNEIKLLALFLSKRTRCRVVWIYLCGVHYTMKGKGQVFMVSTRQFHALNRYSPDWYNELLFGTRLKKEDCDQLHLAISIHGIISPGAI